MRLWPKRRSWTGKTKGHIAGVVHQRVTLCAHQWEDISGELEIRYSRFKCSACGREMPVERFTGP